MSANGTKRTSPVAPHMSAFAGKADIKNLGEFAKGVAESKIFPSFAFRFEPPDPSSSDAHTRYVHAKMRNTCPRTNVPLCCFDFLISLDMGVFPNPLTALRSAHKLVRPKGSRIAPAIHFLTTNITIHAVRVRGWCSAGPDLVQGSAFARVCSREPFSKSAHSRPRSTVSR